MTHSQLALPLGSSRDRLEDISTTKKTFEPLFSTPTNKMPNFFETPSKINEYLILPIQLPASGAGDLATHYLYLRRHEPKVPTKDDSRSLFSVNVPVDATEAHLRGLFSNIGGGRVERVVFEGEEKTEGVTSGVGAESRKRKRGEDLGAKEAAAVIKTWDREIGRSGATAVIVFVDSASREMSLKAVAKAVTKSKKKSGSGDGAVVWGEGISDGSKIPALGISRTTLSFFLSAHLDWR